MIIWRKLERALHGSLRRGGLRATIITWFLVPTAIILGAVALLTSYAYQHVTENLVLERNHERTTLLAGQLGNEIARYAQSLDALAAHPELWPPAQRQTTLSRLWREGHEPMLFDAGILILDPSATVTACVPLQYGLVGKPLPELAHPATPTGNDTLALSDVLPDVVPGTDVVALSRPIWDGRGTFQGTVVGLFRAERGATRTSRFYRNMWDLYIGRRQTAYLVDSAGRIIFHPDTFLIGENVADHETVQQALAGRSGATRTRDLEGRAVVAGYAPVPDTPWGLVTEEGWDDLLRTSRPYTRFLLLLLGLSILVPVVIVALGTRRITDPIAQMSRAAQRVAGGDFCQAIAVHTGDELEALAGHFNTMASQLQASYANLEARVADRTRELAALNAISTVVSRSLELDEVLQAALVKTMEVTVMEAGVAFRLNDQTLILLAAQGLSDALVRRIQRMPLVSSIAAPAVATRVPIVRFAADYPKGWPQTPLAAEGLQQVISVPLVAKNEVLGVINLATRAPRTITRDEQALLASIGQQVGVAVENARLYEQAETAAAAEERNRLARELHDAVSQTLFSASLIADVLPRLWERAPETALQRLEMLRRLTRGAMAEMRTLLMELRPAALAKANLDDLLRQLGEAVAGQTLIEVALDLDPAPVIEEDAKVTLYRIAQEALNNVIKHAGAGSVTVGLHMTPLPHGEQSIELSIADDGHGFDASRVTPGRLGLENMRERAAGIGASFSIESDPGRGTRALVTWVTRTTCRTEEDE